MTSLAGVVIAHGAWADATSWREVIALLQDQGLRVVAVQNPLTALADDVDAVTRVLDHQPSPVVLVGHGYGGTVITQAGSHQGVAALVYIAAWAPDSASRRLIRRRALLRCLHRQTRSGRRGFLYLAPDAVLEFLAHDLPATEGVVLAAAQQPIRASALLDRVTEAAWHTKPSWYAVTDEDRMCLPPCSGRSPAGSMRASSFSALAMSRFSPGRRRRRTVILAAVVLSRRRTPVSRLRRRAIGSRLPICRREEHSVVRAESSHRTAVDA